MMPKRIWFGLYWVLFSFFDHHIKIGEVIGFRLFRATGLAFAIHIQSPGFKGGGGKFVIQVHEATAPCACHRLPVRVRRHDIHHPANTGNVIQHSEYIVSVF